MTKKLALFCRITTLWLAVPLSTAIPLHAQSSAVASHGSGAAVLRPADYSHYVDTFHSQERDATGKLYEGEGGEDTWAWMLHEIPWFDASD